MSHDLESVIVAVFSGQAVSEGNKYLFDFIELEAAWEASMQLFESTHDYVQYFGANMLYTKVRKHWHQLNTAQRTAVYEHLKSYVIRSSDVDSSGTRKTFSNRIVLALCCVSARAPGGVNAFAQLAFEMLGSFQSTRDLFGLEMLAIIPTEIGDLDVSRSLKLELEEQLHSMMPRVLHVVDSVGSIETDPRIQTEALKLLRAWVMQGITLSALFEDHPQTAALVFAAMRSGDAARVKESLCFLGEVFTIKDFPAGDVRTRAVTTVMHTITTQAGALSPFFGPGGDENVAHEICNTMVSLATHEMEILSNPHTCSVGFFELLLSCASQRPRKTASLTFDVWPILQDIPVADRHPYLSQELFYKLLDITFGQVMYPHDFTTWSESSEDFDDFDNFRDHRQGIKDNVLGCFYALQTSVFFTLMSAKMAIVTQTGSWQTLEAVLYILHTAMDGVKSSTHVPESKQAVVQFITSIVQMVLTLPAALAAQACLQETVCKFLGSITFLLVDESSPEAVALFSPCVQFLYRATHAPSTRASAAKSLYQLCIHGNPLLLTPQAAPGAQLSPPLILALVSATAGDIMGRPDPEIDQAAYLQVIEALVRTVVLLPAELAQEQILVLGRPLTMRLAHELAQPVPSDDVVHVLLLYGGHIVRFSDVTGDDSTHVLIPFLSELWPHLQALEANAHLLSSVAIIEKLFGLYSRVLQSVSFVMVPQLPHLTGIIAQLFQSKNPGCAAALSCAASAVEVLMTRSDTAVSTEIRQFLAEVLMRLTEIFTVNVAQSVEGPGALFGYEPEAVEKYFAFVYSLMTFGTQIVAESACLSHAIALTQTFLGACKERGPVRVILQIVQFVFQPGTRVDGPVLLHILNAGCEFGGSFVQLIFSALNGGLPNMLWSNVIDALLAIISGCEDTGKGAECRAWVTAALSQPEILSTVTMDGKKDIFQAIFHHAVNNRRRFKALLQDIAKISNGEQSVDSLVSYFDI